MIKSRWAFFLSFLLSVQLCAQTEPIIRFLETPVSTESFMLFRAQNRLDNTFANPALGLKIYTDVNRQKVKAIMFTNKNQSINNKLYAKYTGRLPFDLKMDFSLHDIKRKVDSSCVTKDGFAYFVKENVLVTVDFTDTKKMDTIRTISFRYDTLRINEYKASGVLDDLYKCNDATDLFKASILNVFASAQRFGLKNIMQFQFPRRNIWNYKYTYKTNIAVPGELYNFVYAFPFFDSQLDFVSILTESHSQIQLVYNKYDAQIKASFPTTEGWEYSYQINREKANAPRDIVVKHPQIGTLVLDYTMSPKGVEVVYLRFLFLYH